MDIIDQTERNSNKMRVPAYSLDACHYHLPAPGAPTWLARRDIAADFLRDVNYALWKFIGNSVAEVLEIIAQDFLVRLKATEAHVVSRVEPENAIDRITPKVGHHFVCIFRPSIYDRQTIGTIASRFNDLPLTGMRGRHTRCRIYP